MAPDGAELDGYFLSDQPARSASGTCIAIIHRLEGDGGKLVIAPAGKSFTDEQIEELVRFQEQWFEHEIVRAVE
jgi:inorganic pyrophosphatase